MSVINLPTSPAEDQLERATARLDAALKGAIQSALDEMADLIGENGATARIAGRIAFAARQPLRRTGR